MVYRRVTGDQGIIVLNKDAAPTIRKIDAHICLVFIPPRRYVNGRSGLITSEVGPHWEPITSNGCVVRCHTRYEAEEMRLLLLQGVQEGQWLDVRIESYTPTDADLPFHDWIRGVRGRQMAALNISDADLPENQDQALSKMSDAEWLHGGPR